MIRCRPPLIRGYTCNIPTHAHVELLHVYEQCVHALVPLSCAYLVFAVLISVVMS